MKTPILHTLSTLILSATVLMLPLHAQPTPAAPAAPAAPVTPYAPKAPDSASLRDTYKGIFHIGVAIGPNQIGGNNPQAAALILKDFDCTSPENVMKMGQIHPQPGNDDSSYNFGPADQYVDFGVKNHLFVIGHNLCWHSQMPNWLNQQANNPTVTKEELTQFLHDHIMKVVSRYKGRVNGWDVVNEALNDGQGGYRNSIFYRVIGPEFLVMAFKWAHEADPAAELYYNDYNLDANDAKRASCVELVKYLKANGAPITGVGMQGHYSLAAPTAAKIDETIGMFAALGMKVMITELDVTVSTNTTITGAVGANATGGGTPAAGRGAGRGAAAPAFVPPPVAPPTLDSLKTALTLTEAQAAQISPLLDELAKSYGTVTAAQGKVTAANADAGAKIAALLTDAQKAQFATLTNPGGARGARGRGGRGGGAPVLNDEQQQALAKRYGEIFAVFLKHRDAVTRVTLWGLSDPESWRAQNSPLLFQAGYVRKPAYDAVINAVKVAGVKN